MSILHLGVEGLKRSLIQSRLLIWRQGILEFLLFDGGNLSLLHLLTKASLLLAILLGFALLRTFDELLDDLWVRVKLDPFDLLLSILALYDLLEDPALEGHLLFVEFLLQELLCIPQIQHVLLLGPAVRANVDQTNLALDLLSLIWHDVGDEQALVVRDIV